MKCPNPNCQAEMEPKHTSKGDVCPFCGCLIGEGYAEKRKLEFDLHDRSYQIDRLFGMNINYEKYDTKELERYYDSVAGTYQKKRDELTNEENDKVLGRLDKIEDAIQSRYPIIPEAKHEEPCLSGKSVADKVVALLNPPLSLFPCAAFQIRESVQRKLSDKYHVVLSTTGNDWSEIFLSNKIVDSKDEAYKAQQIFKYLNCYVHGKKDNDVKLANHFKEIGKTPKQFLEDSLNFFKKLHLIGQED